MSPAIYPFSPITTKHTATRLCIWDQSGAPHSLNACSAAQWPRMAMTATQRMLERPSRRHATTPDDFAMLKIQPSTASDEVHSMKDFLDESDRTHRSKRTRFKSCWAIL